MRTLYIVKTGSTFPTIAQQHQDFEHWIAAGLRRANPAAATALPVAVVQAADSDWGPLTYPDVDACAGVVITGSHAMVTEGAPWMHDLQQWLGQVCAAQLPVLGICFGHQILAQTLGGTVARHPAGLELGTVPVALQAAVDDDPLWQHMPACFAAHTVHFQSVRQAPPQAQILAGNSHEACHAFRWGRHAWGVQFHPEFDAAAMHGYIDHIQASAEALPTPPRCYDTPEAASLLPQFAAYVQRHALLRSP